LLGDWCSHHHVGRFSDCCLVEQMLVGQSMKGYKHSDIEPKERK
jgi:hypothetical protein